MRVDGRDARWAEHRSSRRNELVRAARRAVHHRGHELSMDELAAEMGTSKSIIYRYFTDKSGLQAAVGAAVLEDLRGALEEVTSRLTRPKDRIGAMVEVYAQIVESSAAVYEFVTQPDAPATAGEVRGFVAEIEDIVAESLLPIIRPEAEGSQDDHDRDADRHGSIEDGEAGQDDAGHAAAALWAAGVVGLVRSAVERWIAARAGGEGQDLAEQQIAAKDRAELTTHITDWLWEGAVGAARRARIAHDRISTTEQ